MSLLLIKFQKYFRSTQLSHINFSSSSSCLECQKSIRPKTMKVIFPLFSLFIIQIAMCSPQQIIYTKNNSSLDVSKRLGGEWKEAKTNRSISLAGRRKEIEYFITQKILILPRDAWQHSQRRKCIAHQKFKTAMYLNDVYILISLHPLLLLLFFIHFDAPARKKESEQIELSQGASLVGAIRLEGVYCNLYILKRITNITMSDGNAIWKNKVKR